MKKTETVTKVLLVFAIAIFILGLIPSDLFPKRYIGTVCWVGLVIVWMVRVKHNIVQDSIRHYLLMGGVMLVLLFLFRTMRYYTTDEYPVLGRYLWYGYYIPFIVLPLMGFMMSISTGKTKEEARSENKLIKNIIRIIASLLIVSVFTNDIHHGAVRIEYSETGGTKSTYGVLWYFIFVWLITLSLSAFGVLIRKCRVSGCRKRWYVPAIVFAIGFIMYVAYYANGGNSPEIFGIRLYLIQEVSVLLFVGTCEAAIHIGLIPSNSGYNSVFENAGWNVAMADGDGNIVKTSGDMEGITSSEIMRSLKEPVPVRDGYVMKAVRNDEGITAWLTDISGIEKVSRELKAASIELEGENDIIQKESEIKLQRASIEAQNRLYDSVVPILKPQIDSIMKLLDEATDESLLKATVMCIYVKRRFNLFLVADGKEYIPSDELYFCIRETIEAISELGIPAYIEPFLDVMIPSGQAFLAYDFFERLMEKYITDIKGIFVNFSVLSNLEMGAPDGNSKTNGVQKLEERLMLNIGSASGGDIFEVFSRPGNWKKSNEFSSRIEIDEDEDASVVTLRIGGRAS